MMGIQLQEMIPLRSLKGVHREELYGLHVFWDVHWCNENSNIDRISEFRIAFSDLLSVLLPHKYNLMLRNIY